MRLVGGDMPLLIPPPPLDVPEGNNKGGAVSAKRIKKDSRGKRYQTSGVLCVRIRGEQSPTSHGSGCLGQVSYTKKTSPAQPSRLTAATVYHIHTTKSSPFCEKIQKDWILYAKSTKKCKISQKASKKGEERLPAFCSDRLGSARLFATALPSPRRKKRGEC